MKLMNLKNVELIKCIYIKKSCYIKKKYIKNISQILK